MVLTTISAHSVWHLNISVLDLRASGSEFQRTLPEYYARLKKVNHRDWYTGRDWFQEHLAARDSGTFPDITVCIRTALLSLSLRGRLDRKL